MSQPETLRQYRFFRVAKDGTIGGFEDHECRDDPHALEKAQAEAGDFGIEVWLGKEMIGRIGGFVATPQRDEERRQAS